MHSSLSSMSESKHAFVFVFCFILSYFFCIFSINQLWDMKQPNQCYNHFQAHSNSVFTLNWHPEDKYCLATGGRDQFIRSRPYLPCIVSSGGQTTSIMSQGQSWFILHLRPSPHVTKTVGSSLLAPLLSNASKYGASYLFGAIEKNVFKNIWTF